MPAGLGRRAFLKAAGALGLLALVPARRLQALVVSAPGPGQAGRFLTAHELDTLRAVTARFVPGPPDDPDPGALEAGVAEAIDLLLAAFTLDPPLIHAGGPFSDRAGATHDDFADFVPLGAHAALGWRIRLEGSQGLPEREFAGPVTGLQEIYRSGLAHLDERSQQAFGVDFKDAPGPAQDLLLSDQTDGDVPTFVGPALANTLEAMYGPPEYGGNRSLGARDRRVPGPDPREGAEPSPRPRHDGPDRLALRQRRGEGRPLLREPGRRPGAAYRAQPVRGRPGRGALVRGRREHAAHGGGRRHRALGREDAALLAPGLQGPLALRAGARRQRRRLAARLRRPGAVLRRGRAAPRRAGRRGADAGRDARPGAAQRALPDAAQPAQLRRGPPPRRRPPPRAPPPP